MQVGGVAGGGGAGIDHDDLQGFFGLALAFEQALKQHRMAVGRVGANQHHQIGQIEIVVTAGRAIGAQAAGVSRHRRTHAKPRIGIEIVATQGPFEQLVGDVVILGEELARAIHGQPRGSLAGEGLLNLINQNREGLLPVDRAKGLVEPLAPLGLDQAVLVEGFGHRGPLNAHLAQGGGVLAVAPHAPAGGPGFGFGGRIAWFELQAATNAAVGTLGPGGPG